jgi:hypothetical protein
LVPSERLTAIRSVDTSTWPVRTNTGHLLETTDVAATGRERQSTAAVLER